MFRCWRKRQQRRYSVKNGSNTTDEDCISFHIWCIILSFFNIQWTTKIKWKSKISCALCAWNRTHFYIVITQILYIYDLMHFFIDQLVQLEILSFDWSIKCFRSVCCAKWTAPYNIWKSKKLINHSWLFFSHSTVCWLEFLTLLTPCIVNIHA